VARAWRRRRDLLLIAVGVLATAVGIVAYATNLLRATEQQTIDKRFSIRGPIGVPPNLAIVGIDAATFNYLRSHRLPSQWPFPRRDEAQVIDNLHRAGARVVAVDIQFTEPTDPADDQALANAILMAGHVVLVTTEVGPGGSTEILGGNANLQALGARPANSAVIPDSDGVLRRFEYSIQGLQTFPVVVAETATGHPVSPSAFGGSSLPIDFVGRPGTIPTVSFSTVYSGHFNPALFRNKIVFIGATAPVLQDVHATAVSGSEAEAGAEIQANATYTVLRDFPLRDAPGWLTIALVAMLGLVPPLVSIRLHRLRALALAVAIGVVYLVVCQLAFNGGLILDVVDPLLALALGTVGTLAVLYLSETVERERTRALFARFVPGGVVDQVLARTDENLRLGAVERDCTVLFSDLRGFTSFSESLSSERVLAVVNVNLEEMTEAILAAGGTLIAYAGDGIMALFGAPLEQPDHADRALIAAREMIGLRLDRFNAWACTAARSWPATSAPTSAWSTRRSATP
jgi:adenylate cyclase